MKIILSKLIIIILNYIYILWKNYTVEILYSGESSLWRKNCGEILCGENLCGEFILRRKSQFGDETEEDVILFRFLVIF